MSKHFLGSSLVIATIILGASGCQKNNSQLNLQNRKQTQSIDVLEQRISRLEQLLKKGSVGNNKPKELEPNNIIKSLTFRIGTKDDRLRIYWNDGTSSDLPCTKEQSIWVCG